MPTITQQDASDALRKARNLKKSKQYAYRLTRAFEQAVHDHPDIFTDECMRKNGLPLNAAQKTDRVAKQCFDVAKLFEANGRKSDAFQWRLFYNIFNPNRIDNLLIIARTLISLDLHEEALPFIDRVVRRHKKYRPTKPFQKAHALSTLANTHFQLQNFGLAAKHFEESIAINKAQTNTPDRVLIPQLILMGHCLMNLDKPGEALDYYEDAHSLKPKNQRIQRHVDNARQAIELSMD